MGTRDHYEEMGKTMSDEHKKLTEMLGLFKGANMVRIEYESGQEAWIYNEYLEILLKHLKVPA